jgi:hypothetical protein
MSDPSDLEAEGIPPIDDAPPGLEDQYNQIEGMMPPGDQPMGATEFGVTAEEERQQEPLAERVRREEPEVSVGTGDVLGRLVEPDQGMVDYDDEESSVASESDDADGLSAEEAAMHITDTP